MKIIYKTPENTVTVLCPGPLLVKHSDLEKIAQKDVPTGLKYKIVEDSVIPTDDSFRNAWEVDEEALTDGIGADYGVLE